MCSKVCTLPNKYSLKQSKCGYLAKPENREKFDVENIAKPDGKEPYKYLGVDFSKAMKITPSILFHEIIGDLKKILASILFPWQMNRLLQIVHSFLAFRNYKITNNEFGRYGHEN